jgi:hypothetical protein
MLTYYTAPAFNQFPSHLSHAAMAMAMLMIHLWQPQSAQLQLGPHLQRGLRVVAAHITNVELSVLTDTGTCDCSKSLYWQHRSGWY